MILILLLDIQDKLIEQVDIAFQELKEMRVDRCKRSPKEKGKETPGDPKVHDARVFLA